MTLRPIAAILSVFTVAALVSACKSTSAPQPAVTADTWAVVNGKAITRQDVDKAFRRAQDPSQPLSDEDTLNSKLNILNDLITQDILLAKAAQAKVDATAAEIDAAVADARKGIPDDAFKQELTRRGITEAEVRDSLRNELVARKLLAQDVTSKVVVSDQEISDFFNANKAQFNVPEEGYHLAQLVVTPVREAQQTNRRGDDATTPQAAASKVQALMERLKQGAPFTELAADYSEDPESSGRGGDIGLVTLSRLKQAPPPLRDAVIGKAPGAATVVTQNGAYTIVLVISHEMAGQRDLSTPAVKDQITQLLRGRREQLLRNAYLTAARSDAQVTNYLARQVVASNGKAVK